MEKLIGISIVVVLLFLYLLVLMGCKKESYTNQSLKKEKKCEDCEDPVSDSKINIENKQKKENESETDAEEVVSSSEKEAENTIYLKDTVRRESKIPSSLGFTYLDENCEKLLKPRHPDYPIEKVNVSKPITPLVSICSNEENQHVNFHDLKTNQFLREDAVVNKNKHVSQSEIETSEHRNYSKNVNIPKERKTEFDTGFNSEIFDDSDLKPRPDVDSPYGFVYFPNKYWKQWARKPPVCTPTSKCKVLPTYTHGAPVDVLDYTQIGSMMPKFNYHEEFEEKS